MYRNYQTDDIKTMYDFKNRIIEVAQELYDQGYRGVVLKNITACRLDYTPEKRVNVYNILVNEKYPSYHEETYKTPEELFNEIKSDEFSKTALKISDDILDICDWTIANNNFEFTPGKFILEELNPKFSTIVEYGVNFYNEHPGRIDMSLEEFELTLYRAASSWDEVGVVWSNYEEFEQDVKDYLNGSFEDPSSTQFEDLESSIKLNEDYDFDRDKKFFTSLEDAKLSIEKFIKENSLFQKDWSVIQFNGAIGYFTDNANSLVTIDSTTSEIMNNLQSLVEKRNNYLNDLGERFYEDINTKIDDGNFDFINFKNNEALANDLALSVSTEILKEYTNTEIDLILRERNDIKSMYHSSGRENDQERIERQLEDLVWVEINEITSMLYSEIESAPPLTAKTVMGSAPDKIEISSEMEM